MGLGRVKEPELAAQLFNVLQHGGAEKFSRVANKLGGTAFNNYGTPQQREWVQSQLKAAIKEVKGQDSWTIAGKAGQVVRAVQERDQQVIDRKVTHFSKNGAWRTAPDLTGVMLVAPDETTGKSTPLTNLKGEPIIWTWDQINTYERARGAAGKPLGAQLMESVDPLRMSGPEGFMEGRATAKKPVPAKTPSPPQIPIQGKPPAKTPSPPPATGPGKFPLPSFLQNPEPGKR
jgi:hypothetical protein